MDVEKSSSVRRNSGTAGWEGEKGLEETEYNINMY